MTEISYITQNGEQINLKDAKGRELLETKQSKLKAGNGISIAADGTISATGAGGAEKAYSMFSEGTSNDEYNNLGIANVSLFKKGHRYKASASFPSYPSLDQNATKMRIYARLEQGSLGYKGYGEDISMTLAQFVSNHNYGGGQEVSGWSPKAIRIGKNLKNNYDSKVTDIDKDSFPDRDADGYVTIDLGEFDYTFVNRGQFIYANKEGFRDDNGDIAYLTGDDPRIGDGADWTGYVASDPTLFFYIRQIDDNGEELSNYENLIYLHYGPIIITFEEVK